ncbi:MAG: hypothetical protein A4S16_05690 [Proteobacteria bacterium SG_bin6]|nr:MAG: hypothetical protein A4S16_05690 [Proteobacteria bacterium SG_bin6]
MDMRERGHGTPAAEWRERQRLAALPVLDALDVLGRLTRAEVPALSAVTKARLVVQRSELARRAELDPFLARRQALALLALRRPYDTRLREQICRWSVPSVVADWKGYCRESRICQGMMHDLLLAEQRWFALEVGG